MLRSPSSAGMRCPSGALASMFSTGRGIHRNCTQTGNETKLLLTKKLQCIIVSFLHRFHEFLTLLWLGEAVICVDGTKGRIGP